MKNQFYLSRSILIFSLPILIILTMIGITKMSTFQTNPTNLSTAITIDLLLTLPFVYYLIIRKRNIPKTTVIPIFIIGIVVASFILPKEQQTGLDIVKTYVLLLLEITVISFVIFKVGKAIKHFKQNQSDNVDFFSVLNQTTAKIVPGRLAKAVAMEIAVFYFGFYKWKLTELKSNEYSYHKETGTRAILLVIIFLVLIETFVFHLILIENYPIIAWVLTGLSVYSGLQILGMLKSLSQRPTVIKGNRIYIKYGILSEVQLNISDIESIELTTRSIEKEEGITYLSPIGEMEGQNIILHLRSEHTLNGIYGIKKQFQHLAMHLDDVKSFKEKIEYKIID